MTKDRRPTTKDRRPTTNDQRPTTNDRYKTILNMKKLIISILAFAGVSIGAMAADTPTFPGGKEALDKFISTNLIYPQTSKSMGVEGVVNVQFTVNTDGSIGSIKIVRMVDPDLEQEAIRIVKKMPAWIPADKDGVPVEATAQVSVPFVLDNDE